ncbi:retron Ec67 family RNA-directed DNA polymerase/endonuclease [Pseudoalteromonas sp. PAR1]|uniref:retron Ec67 family RNA-directed DNA polymerase/endonuclease n=1 Tax=Pseudoalteromonas sp. PAR1 TaxID=2853443 RepID=UPI00248BF301|nr:retron Ec67 family RNA-directed DNA polymerase/endonuclease [Pseudoalteromonas sp. PAR1]
MSKLKNLKGALTKPQLAAVLGVSPIFLTKCLYIIKPENQYHQFEIDKKSGGKRKIAAPGKELKSLQLKLSELLMDCIDEINAAKYPHSQLVSPKKNNSQKNDSSAEVLKVKISNAAIKQPSLSHGFTRQRSILTNAVMHLGQKNVLNIDLENFFDSFNFGRIRGFFIKNKNFELSPTIATVIAQIACYENTLPQGSPSSPVITNLITHHLDIRLASLAKKYKCTYTRYADDITFSTRLSVFPPEIMCDSSKGYVAGKRLKRAIEHAGFSINERKTRIQYKNSRQDVTGLIVNKKPNIKKEYWRKARAKCNSLFNTGHFTTEKNEELVEGNINELEGQLNFIDQVDHYNRMRQKPPLTPEYSLKNYGKRTNGLLSGREVVFSKFLFYRLFYANEKPTILCEGKTDNIYLKSAINQLHSKYKQLVYKSESRYELLIRFVEYSKRTRFLLELYGGADYLRGFIDTYAVKSKIYRAEKPQNPVIIFIDNDDGPKQIEILLQSKSFNQKTTLSPSTLDPKKDVRKADFIHVINNLYVIFTPRGANDEETDIEYFFGDDARLKKHTNGLFFNSVSKRDPSKDLSKEAFANHIIKSQKKYINFDGLIPLLDRIVKAINHYKSIR